MFGSQALSRFKTMMDNLPYISDNPFRLCNISAATPLTELRRKATAQAKSAAVGIATPTGLPYHFSDTEAVAILPEKVRAIASDACLRTVYRMFWSLAYEHPYLEHLPQNHIFFSKSGQPRGSVYEFDALLQRTHGRIFDTQTAFLRAWYMFLSDPKSINFVPVLPAFSAFYNDNQCDQEFARVLQAEKVNDAEHIVQEAYQTVLSTIFTQTVAICNDLWFSEQFLEASKILKALSDSAFSADLKREQLSKMGDFGDRLCAEVTRDREALENWTPDQGADHFSKVRQLDMLANALADTVPVTTLWQKEVERYVDRLTAEVREYYLYCIRTKSNLIAVRPLIQTLLAEPLTAEWHQQLHADLAEIDRTFWQNINSKHGSSPNYRATTPMPDIPKENKRISFKTIAFLGVCAVIVIVFYIIALSSSPSVDTSSVVTHSLDFQDSYYPPSDTLEPPKTEQDKRYNRLREQYQKLNTLLDDTRTELETKDNELENDQIALLTIKSKIDEMKEQLAKNPSLASEIDQREKGYAAQLSAYQKQAKVSTLR